MARALNDVNNMINTSSNDCQKKLYYLHEINADVCWKRSNFLDDNITVSLIKLAEYIASAVHRL